MTFVVISNFFLDLGLAVSHRRSAKMQPEKNDDSTSRYLSRAVEAEEGGERQEKGVSMSIQWRSLNEILGGAKMQNGMHIFWLAKS
jgi:hypothetical protein